MLSTALAVALAATPVSASKLGVVVQGDDATSRALLAACPRLAVFTLPSPGGADVSAQLRAYKQGCAGAFAIVQFGGRGLAVDGPTANALWATSWSTFIRTVNTACGVPGCVDAVEGPSEPTGLPSNIAGFWSSFAQLVSGEGYLPVIGALAPGLPAGSGTPADAFCAVASAVQATRVPSWAWSYHARSASLTTSVATEGAAVFGYRTIARDCGLPTSALYITEVGPSAPNRPWGAGDASWLAWLDAELANDGVAGAALVQAGAAGTSSLAPVASALADHLANPTPDGGSDGGTDGGDGGSDGGGGAAPGGGGAVGGGPGTPAKGCSSANAGLAAAALLPVLLLRRRRRPTA